MKNLEDELQRFRNMTGSMWSVIYRPSTPLQFKLNSASVTSNIIQTISTLQPIAVVRGKV